MMPAPCIWTPKHPQLILPGSHQYEREVQAIGTGIFSPGLAAVRRQVTTAAATSGPPSANLFAEWRADKTTFQNSDGTTPATANGDPVGYWGDQSANGRHLTQSTAGQRPTLHAANLNGLNTITLSQPAAQHWDITGGPFTLVAFTFYGLVYITSARTSHIISGVSHGIGWELFSTLKQYLVNEAVGAYLGPSNTAVSLSTWTQISLSWTMDSTSKPYEFRIAKGSDGTGNATGPQVGDTVKIATVGGDTILSAYWPGDFAHILIYSAVHSTSDKQAVEAYLTGIWGV